jgi:hypothetical protein
VEKRTNETHAPKTDLEARLYKKAAGQPSQLCYPSTVVENRNGLVVVAMAHKRMG